MVALDATANPANQAKTAATVATGVMASTAHEDTKETKETLANKVLPVLLDFAAPRETKATLVLKGLVELQAFQAHAVKQEETASMEYKAPEVCQA